MPEGQAERSDRHVADGKVYPDLCLIAFARPALLEKVLACLRAAAGIERVRILFHIDLPAREADDRIKSENQAVRRICREFANSVRVTGWTIVEPERSLGCWGSKLNAAKRCLQLWQSAYLGLLEDDVEVGSDFLEYFAACYPLLSRRTDSPAIACLNSNLGSCRHDRTEIGEAEFTPKYPIIEKDPDILARVIAVRWPAPWGFALTAPHWKSILKEWNGHDQALGQHFVDCGGLVLTPVISRSDHIGVAPSYGERSAPMDVNLFFRHFSGKMTLGKFAVPDDEEEARAGRKSAFALLGSTRVPSVLNSHPILQWVSDDRERSDLLQAELTRLAPQIFIHKIFLESADWHKRFEPLVRHAYSIYWLFTVRDKATIENILALYPKVKIQFFEIGEAADVQAFFSLLSKKLGWPSKVGTI